MCTQPTSNSPNPTALHPFFCDHYEEAACGEDCEATRQEGDEATGEGLKPSEKDRSRRRRRRSYRRRIEAAGEEDEATEEGLKSPEKD